MNELGLALGWLAIQVTLAMLPAAALHLLSSRRGPVAGSWMAAAGLAMIVGLTALAFLPQPEIKREPAASTISQYHEGNKPPPLRDAGSRTQGTVGPAASDSFLTLTQARAIWTRLGSRLVLFVLQV